jgi:Ni2+-binding GTPase involved in maturation of urease and hydrogenase
MAEADADEAPVRMALPEYDVETMMHPHSTVIVNGSRGSGKTVFMKYIMYCMRKKFDTAVMFCPTEDTIREFHEFLPKSCIHDHLSTKRLQEVVETQKTLHKEVHRGGVPLRNVAVVLDDCMYDKKTFKCTAVRSIMMNGRHDNLFLLNGVQYIMDFPKELRSQIDVAVVFPVQGAYVKGVMDNLLGDAFKSVDDLAAVFSQLQQHEVLVWDARAQRSGKPYLFYCKAVKDLPRFRFGSDTFWLMHYKYFKRPKHEEHKNIVNAVAKASGKKPVLTLDKGDEDFVEHQGRLDTPGTSTKAPTIIVRRVPLTTKVPVVTGTGPAVTPAKPTRRRRVRPAAQIQPMSIL